MFSWLYFMNLFTDLPFALSSNLIFHSSLLLPCLLPLCLSDWVKPVNPLLLPFLFNSNQNQDDFNAQLFSFLQFNSPLPRVRFNSISNRIYLYMDTAVYRKSESSTVPMDQPRNVSVVNGYIVYTRAKRSLDSCKGFFSTREIECGCWDCS